MNYFIIECVKLELDFSFCGKSNTYKMLLEDYKKLPKYVSSCDTYVYKDFIYFFF